MKFEQGNKMSSGRPRGSRNKLAKRFFEDMSEVWDEPTPDGKSTRGKAALRLMWRERPGEFAKLYAAVMPREFWVDNVTSELTDEEIDRAIEVLREQIRAERALELNELKVIEHAQ